MTCRRFDLTDFEWRIIQPLLPNKSRGVPRVDDRRVINGILWRFRTGSPWADVPERYGPYTTCYNRFVDADARPIGIDLTPGQSHDSKVAEPMLKDIGRGTILLADTRRDFQQKRQATSGHASSMILAAYRSYKASSGLDICRQSLEDLNHSIGNRLPKHIARLAYRLFVHISCGKGYCRTLLGDNLTRALDSPLRKVSATINYCRFH
jgi:transposase